MAACSFNHDGDGPEAGARADGLCRCDFLFSPGLEWPGAPRARRSEARHCDYCGDGNLAEFLEGMPPRECPGIFVNGRISERSFRGYRRAFAFSGGLLRGFLKRVLNDVPLFLMQSEQDAARLLALGAPEESVLVTGNLKYDLAEPPESPISIWLADEFAKNHRRPVLVAGSVMADEENLVLRGYVDVERKFPNAQLILAPRKPDQFDRRGGNCDALGARTCAPPVRSR